MNLGKPSAHVTSAHGSNIGTTRVSDDGGGKRPFVDDDGEEVNHGNGESKQAPPMFKRSCCSTKVTVRRVQNMTIPGYKPGDGTNNFGVSVLPVSVLDFWVQKEKNGWAKPFDDLCSVFPFIYFEHASIKISRFIPLQKSLQGANATDVTSFNIAPYLYISEDPYGYIPSYKISNTNDVFYRQCFHVPSIAFWKNDHDEGLLGLGNVDTLHSGEVWGKHYDLNNSNYFLLKTPKYAPGKYTYLPGNYWDGTSIYPLEHKSVGYDKVNKDQITFSNSKGMQPVHLFMPFIESISDSENVTRMLGHVVMETSITMRLMTQPDNYSKWANTKHKTIELRQGDNTNTDILFAI